MSKKTSILLVAILLLGLASGAYYLFANRPAGTPIETIVEEQITPTEFENEFEGWETTTSEEVGITISYPAGVDLVERQDEALSLVKVGPTQTEGTEMYDGFALTFTTDYYNEDSLEKFVETQRQQAQEDMIIEEVGDIENITIANMNGYQFTQVGLGKFTLIYLPREEGRYMLISMIVEDPGNLGFQHTVDTILSTLVFE